MGELLEALEALYGEKIELACYSCGRPTKRTVVSKDGRTETGWCGRCPLPENPKGGTYGGSEEGPLPSSEEGGGDGA